ncbi:hypothetical protein [Streptomyces sp. NPDC001135]
MRKHLGIRFRADDGRSIGEPGLPTGRWAETVVDPYVSRRAHRCRG